MKRKKFMNHHLYSFRNHIMIVNNRLLPLGLAAIIVSVIYITACKSDLLFETDSSEKEFINSLTHGRQGVNTEIHRDFVQNFKHPHTIKKRSGYLTIPQAEYELNHGMNSLYCRPGLDDYEKTYAYYDTISVPINASSEIDENDIVIAMGSIANFAGGIFFGRSTTNKVSWMFDIEEGLMTSSSVEFNIIYIMQEESRLVTTESYPYRYEWGWAHNGSTWVFVCDSNPDVEIGADDLFRKDLRNNLVYKKDKTEAAFYYTDLYVVCFKQEACGGLETSGLLGDLIINNLTNPDDPVPGDNYYEELLWTSTSNEPNYHTCLLNQLKGIDEMNFHYEEMSDLIEQEKPINRDVIANIEVGYEALFTGVSRLYHGMQGHYTLKNPLAVGNEIPIPLPGPN